MKTTTVYCDRCKVKAEIVSPIEFEIKKAYTTNLDHRPRSLRMQIGVSSDFDAIDICTSCTIDLLELALKLAKQDMVASSVPGREPL